VYGSLNVSRVVELKPLGGGTAGVELEDSSGGTAPLFDFWAGGELSVADTEFRNFKESVFYMAHPSTSLALDNCNVTGNAASLYGAGIYCDSCDKVAVTDSILSNNVATLRGAAIYAYGAAQAVLISDTVMRNNSLDYYEGAVSRSPPPQTRSYSFVFVLSFSDHQPRLASPRLASPHHPPSIQASTGGGMYLGSAKANITGTVFSDNTAVRGGALYIAASGFESLIHESKFLNNKARSGGGALYKYSGQ
jgi:hypothetical protein